MGWLIDDEGFIVFFVNIWNNDEKEYLIEMVVLGFEKFDFDIIVNKGNLYVEVVYYYMSYNDIYICCEYNYFWFSCSFILFEIVIEDKIDVCY